MPRFAREKSESGFYHVMMRGIDKREIFLAKSDYERFLSYLEKLKEQGLAIIYAYCLMPNHTHILLRSATEDIGDVIRRITVGYAQYHNIKYGRTGHLFQNRFRSEPVDDDRYFLTVLRYIHQNPVKAGIAANIKDYEWSSYPEYLNNQAKLVNISFALNFFPDLPSFVQFSNQENEDRCLEYELQARYSDQVLKEYLASAFDLNQEKIKKIDIKSRNTLLKSIKDRTGVGSRQLARVLGIGRSIVNRIER